MSRSSPLITNARLDCDGSLIVDVEGVPLCGGGKYTILEMGWALYFPYAVGETLSREFLARYGETRPQMDGWNELRSDTERLVTTHPVLVALNLLAWWHRNGKQISTAPVLVIPSFDKAIEIVRGREILNDFNNLYRGQVPGLERWGPS